jgi:methionyl-tRNA formyltransferase
MDASATKRRPRGESFDEGQLPPDVEQRRQMALRHVRQYPDPVLRVPTDEVVDFDEELAALVERMSSIMGDAHGIGLAAPQLGLRLRLFTFQPEEGPAEAVINPRITWSSDETDVDEEGCLSLGDFVRVQVRRPIAIKVEAKDVTGADRTWELDDYYARVFQHEIDHLDGVLMIDRADDEASRKDAMSRLRPRPEVRRSGMALAFAGTAPFGAAMLRALLDGPGDGRPGREVALVISQPDRPKGRGKQLASPPVAELAKERGVRLVQPERMHEPELLELYRELGIETFVVAAFGQMVREPLLSDYLMLNVHGSILPEYRGAAPIERSIMDGRSETGVDIMRMEAGLDTGPIAERARVPIAIDDDAGAVFAKLEAAGGRILFDALERNDAGTLEFEPQPETGETYAHKIVAADRMLDPARETRALHDQVRALSPHVGAWLLVDGERLGLWRTRMADADAPVARRPGAIWHDTERLVIGTADGALEVLELQPPGKRRMAAGDWLRGLRAPLVEATAPEPAPAG